MPEENSRSVDFTRRRDKWELLLHKPRGAQEALGWLGQEDAAEEGLKGQSGANLSGAAAAGALAVARPAALLQVVPVRVTRPPEKERKKERIQKNKKERTRGRK